MINAKAAAAKNVARSAAALDDVMGGACHAGHEVHLRPRAPGAPAHPPGGRHPRAGRQGTAHAAVAGPAPPLPWAPRACAPRGIGPAGLRRLAVAAGCAVRIVGRSSIPAWLALGGRLRCRARTPVSWPRASSGAQTWGSRANKGSGFRSHASVRVAACAVSAQRRAAAHRHQWVDRENMGIPMSNWRTAELPRKFRCFSRLNRAQI